MPRAELWLNNTIAIGAPFARLFLDPQKTAATSSGLSNPRALLAKVVAVRTVPSNRTTIRAISAKVVVENLDQRPSAVDSQNAP
jgi:hypothetical protein